MVHSHYKAIDYSRRRSGVKRVEALQRIVWVHRLAAHRIGGDAPDDRPQSVAVRTYRIEEARLSRRLAEDRRAVDRRIDPGPRANERQAAQRRQSPCADPQVAFDVAPQVMSPPGGVVEAAEPAAAHQEAA